MERSSINKHKSLGKKKWEQSGHVRHNSWFMAHTVLFLSPTQYALLVLLQDKRRPNECISPSNQYHLVKKACWLLKGEQKNWGSYKARHVLLHLILKIDWLSKNILNNLTNNFSQYAHLLFYLLSGQCDILFLYSQVNQPSVSTAMFNAFALNNSEVFSTAKLAGLYIDCLETA